MVWWMGMASGSSTGSDRAYLPTQPCKPSHKIIDIIINRLVFSSFGNDSTLAFSKAARADGSGNRCQRNRRRTCAPGKNPISIDKIILLTIHVHHGVAVLVHRCRPRMMSDNCDRRRSMVKFDTQQRARVFTPRALVRVLHDTLHVECVGI